MSAFLPSAYCLLSVCRFYFADCIIDSYLFSVIKIRFLGSGMDHSAGPAEFRSDVLIWPFSARSTSTCSSPWAANRLTNLSTKRSPATARESSPFWLNGRRWPSAWMPCWRRRSARAACAASNSSPGTWAKKNSTRHRCAAATCRRWSRDPAASRWCARSRSSATTCKRPTRTARRWPSSRWKRASRNCSSSWWTPSANRMKNPFKRGANPPAIIRSTPPSTMFLR